MSLLIFLLALAGGIFALEVVSLLTRQRLTSPLAVQVGDTDGVDEVPQTSAWYAILGVVLPQWFNPEKARGREKVVGLIRRAGYHPYGSVNEFYVGAMAEFGKGIVEAAFLAAVLVILHLPHVVTLIVAALILWLAHRRPYTRLKEAARRRAELMRPNMLAGLAELESMLEAGVGVQEALRRTAQLGGPFCNLLGLLVARLEIENAPQALQRVRQHIPDPEDTNMILFLRDLEDYFLRQRPLLQSVRSLRRSVHQDIVNATVARASKVQRTAGLFGILAVIGMLISILAPVFGAGL
jgi:hypothetical protein